MTAKKATKAPVVRKKKKTAPKPRRKKGFVAYEQIPYRELPAGRLFLLRETLYFKSATKDRDGVPIAYKIYTGKQWKPGKNPQQKIITPVELE